MLQWRHEGRSFLLLLGFIYTSHWAASSQSVCLGSSAVKDLISGPLGPSGCS